MIRIVFDPEFRRIRRRVAISFTAFLIAIVGFMALSPAEVAPLVAYSDKTLHLIAFVGLALPCAVLYPRSLVWIVPIILLFGAAIEFVQPHVGRHRELSDFYADAIGTLGGVIVGLTCRKLLRLAI